MDVADNNPTMDNPTALPSRKYTCIICGTKGRRGNKPEQRRMDPICPPCQSDMWTVERILPTLPKFLEYYYSKRQNTNEHC